MRQKQKIQKQGGFMALMATIIISLILVVMVTEEGATGFRARFTVLGTEAKEQSLALAEGCAEQAIASLVTDSANSGSRTVMFPAGTCHIFPIIQDSPAPGLATIKTQAQVRKAYSNLVVTVDIQHLRLGTISPTSNLGDLITGWEEVPTLP